MLQDNELLKIDEAPVNNNICENGSVASSRGPQHFIIATAGPQIKLTAGQHQTSLAVIPSENLAAGGNHQKLRLVTTALEQGVVALDNNVHSATLLGPPPYKRRNSVVVNSVDPVNSSAVISNDSGNKRPRLDETLSVQKSYMMEVVRKDIRELKSNYLDHLTELFFLQSGGNVLDYVTFKKNPVPQLIAFLKTNVLDETDEVLACERASLKPSSEPPPPAENSESSPADGVTKAATAATTPVRPPPTPGSSSAPKTPPPLGNKPQSISAVYDSTIGSQEEIVERAKQEAYVMQRIAELRKEGLWSLKRLPKVQEQPRSKTHWDYLLEEMAWLATDFAQERKWKKNAAKKCAKMIMKYHQDKELKAEREGLPLP